MKIMRMEISMMMMMVTIMTMTMVMMICYKDKNNIIEEQASYDHDNR